MCNYCILCAPVRSITNNGESVLKMMGSLLFNVSLLLSFFICCTPKPVILKKEMQRHVLEKLEGKCLCDLKRSGRKFVFRCLSLHK